MTVFGESYGAQAISAHLTSPGAEGLFDRAIIQSGFALMDLPAGALAPGLPAVEWFGWQSSAETEAVGAAIAAQLGCADTRTAVIPTATPSRTGHPFQSAARRAACPGARAGPRRASSRSTTPPSTGSSSGPPREREPTTAPPLELLDGRSIPHLGLGTWPMDDEVATALRVGSAGPSRADTREALTQP